MRLQQRRNKGCAVSHSPGGCQQGSAPSRGISAGRPSAPPAPCSSRTDTPAACAAAGLLRLQAVVASRAGQCRARADAARLPRPAQARCCAMPATERMDVSRCVTPLGAPSAEPQAEPMQAVNAELLTAPRAESLELRHTQRGRLWNQVATNSGCCTAAGWQSCGCRD